MTSVVRVLQPNGVLDGNSANDLGTEIINHIQADIKIVLLDFDKVTFMNSSGIGALVSGSIQPKPTLQVRPERI